jgi:PAS domain S-box-containing protein
MNPEEVRAESEKEKLAAENALLRAKVKELEGRAEATAAAGEIETRHRLVLDGVKGYAIFILDERGRFVGWPMGAQRLLGYSSAEVVGRSPGMLLTPADREAGVAEHEIAQAKAEGGASEDRWHVCKDGQRFWGSGVLAALKDDAGRLHGFVKVLRDNTDRKLAEEALKEAKAAAEAANAAKDHFLATVSHELRTPLAAMMLWAKLLEEQNQPSPERVREGLEAIRNCAEEQQELIEDLLDTSRIVAGKLRLELKPANLVATVRSAVDAVRPGAVAKNLTIEERIEPDVGWAMADPHRLQQVVWNLLSNSVKFTPEGGHIGIGMWRRKNEVEIRVMDDGIGIDPQFIGRVFDRFGQAEQLSTRQSGGLGLGLSISNQLVGLHGGKISAQSAGLGRGSTFVISLPLPPIDPPASGSGGSKSPVDVKAHLNGQRVMLLEDMAATRKALALVLREAGAEVMAFDQASDALLEFKKQRPDLIVSDIGMPGIDGHEFIRQIRALEGNEKPTPAVALTAYADENSRTRALAHGFQKCLTKPIEASQFISALAKFKASP